MSRVIAIIAMLFLPLSSFAQGPSHYISDDVFIFIHGGPGTQFRILGSVEAGQAITLQGETQGDYSKIVDHKGREGWVETDLISDKPSFRERLPQLISDLDYANSQLTSLTQNSDSITEQLSSANAQVKQLKAKLATVEQQRDSAEAQVKAVSDNQRYHMWQQGGIIAGIGALIGIILVYLPRPQRRQKSRWM